MFTYKTIMIMTMAALLSISSAAWAGTTYYVDPDGDDDDAGTSWATAFKTVWKGLKEADDGTSTDYAIVDVNSGTYLTVPITMASDIIDSNNIDNNNIRIVFQENVEVRARSNSDPIFPNEFIDYNGIDSDCLFRMMSRSNIIFDGNDTIFAMNKEEYTEGEQRHVIQMRSCTNIEIKSLTCKDSGGDGIHISVDNNNAQKYCDQILIDDVNCDNNRRCGISVISANDLTIQNCLIQNTNGTAPNSGIFFEPWNTDQQYTDIVIRDTIIRKNVAAGISITTGYLRDYSPDLSILCENLYIEGMGDANYNDSAIGVGAIGNNGPDGWIKFKNVFTENSYFALRAGKTSWKVDLSFEDCVWTNVTSSIDRRPVEIANYGDYNEPGGINFINCQIFDDLDRPAIKKQFTNADFYEIHGDIHVYNPNRSGDLYDWNGGTLHNVDLTIHDGLATADINDSDPNWADVNDLQVWDFYVLDSNGDGYWCSKKYLYAASSLDANHCQTDVGTSIAHYHFESDFDSTEVTAANRYWDWYFDTAGTTITRDSNATNVRNSIAYAMDGFKGSANYDYWIAPCDDVNKVFTDDCIKRGAQPYGGERLAYLGSGGIYRHATIVNSVSRDWIPATCRYTLYEPAEIQWKCNYSGVYKWDNSGESDRFSTPGRDNIYQNTGSAPTGTWDPNYWDGDDADMYF